MKSYNNLYSQMLDREYLEKCFRKAAKRKTKRSDVRKVLENLDENVNFLLGILEREEFVPAYHEPKIIHESAARKERRIVKPNYKYEQVVHHAAIGQFSSIVQHGLYEHVCGSIPGRGTHSGSETVEKWIREYNGKKFYVLKTDIRHYYDSVDRGILKEKLKKVIRDKRFLRLTKAGRKPSLQDQKDLSTAIAYGRSGEAMEIVDRYDPDPALREKIEKIITEYRKGIPLGYLTSQWNGNFVLKDLDQYIIQVLRPDRYIRYADDMVFFSTNKRKLRKIREEVDRYMKEELKIEMKKNWQIFRFEYTGRDKEKVRGRMIDFLGFQFHTDRKTLRKSTLKRIRRKALKIGKKDRVTWYDASQMLSYMGSIKHADVYNYYEKYIKENISVKKLKKIVSNHARKEKKQNESKLQKVRKHDRTGSSGSGVESVDGICPEECPEIQERGRPDGLPV